MGKKQRTLSIPAQRYEELENFFTEHNDLLLKIGIESASSLARVLMNLGEKPLLKILEATNKADTPTD